MRGDTDTYIYRRGSSPNTRVAISQKNRVWSTPYSSTTPKQKQVGVLATFDFAETRGIDPVRGVGFGDKIQELVPNVTEPMTITMNRTLLYTAGIVQELGYRGGVDGMVRSLRQHKWPFDIRNELVFSELVTNFDQNMILVPTPGTDPGTLALMTYFEACWFNSISISFPSDSAIVVEDASATCSDVTDGTTLYGTSADTYGDLLDSGNNPLDGQGSRLYTATGGQALGF